MSLFDQFRDVAERLRGGSIAEQSWIDIDGASDTGRLLRAIETIMPRDSRLNVMKPNAAADSVLRKLALKESRPDDGDFLISMENGGVEELAELADALAPSQLCAGVFVVQGDRNLLESYRRDAGEDVVWLNADLDEKIIANFRQALNAAGSYAEPRSAGERPVLSRVA